jgi:3,4-dihydroxy-2-butanone 4-phosphate synthase
MSADRFISDDGIIRVVELGIDADEERQGVIQAYAVTWLNTVTVMVRHASGLIATSSYANRDLVIARAKARESAFSRIEYLLRRVPKATMAEAAE